MTFILYIQSLCFFLSFSLIFEQGGGAARIGDSGSGTFISCSWTGNTGTGNDFSINSDAGSVIIINSKTMMDISGTTSKITTCYSNNPCTASYGGTACAAATSNNGGVVLDMGGVVCSLPACPPIFVADDDHLKDTDGWNVWSASCAMETSGGTFYVVATGKTVKIKKSPSMSGELIIDRGSDTSGNGNRHFWVDGTLELEDITLTGGHGDKGGAVHINGGSGKFTRVHFKDNTAIAVSNLLFSHKKHLAFCKSVCFLTFILYIYTLLVLSLFLFDL